MSRLKGSVERELFWRSMIAEQRRGAVSIRRFCQQKAISEPSFYAWRKKLRERGAKIVARSDGDGRLIPVDVIGSTCEGAAPSVGDVKESLEICTPSGFTLRFGHDTNADVVARLLDIIVRCPTSGAASC